MTTYQKDPTDLRNYFDELERGIGHRGASFTDCDRLCWTHDGKGTSRFLFRELKAQGEKQISEGQKWALSSLAKQPNITVWGGRVLEVDQILWKDFQTDEQAIITGAEWKRRVSAWWEGK